MEPRYIFPTCAIAGPGNHLAAAADPAAMRDIRSLAPLAANEEPFLYGSGIPADLSTVKRGSVALVIRGSGTAQEVLLIKRTSRPTDYWSGHLAFPGGRHEQGETDFETAVRETLEEVGLDLTATADYLGPLDPRLIRIRWGKKLAMVLCPFVFQMRDECCNAELVPQDSEVAAVFWHPLAKLYSPEFRSTEVVPVESRLNLPCKILTKLVASQVGDITFDAVDVTPALPEAVLKPLPATPWKVWGITWGVLQDFQRLVEPRTSVHDVRMPSFKSRDFAAVLSAISSLSTWRKRRAYAVSQADWTNKMLDGYFSYFPYAIVLGILLRAGALALVAKILWRKCIRR